MVEDFGKLRGLIYYTREIVHFIEGIWIIHLKTIAIPINILYVVHFDAKDM